MVGGGASTTLITAAYDACHTTSAALINGACCCLLKTTLSCQVTITTSDFQSKYINSVVNIVASGAQKLLKKLARQVVTVNDSQLGLET